eukprot:2378627-Pyramimonas_sp.AAC.1
MASKTAEMAQDGLQVRPRWSKMASKTAQEGPRCLLDRPRSLKTGQDGSKMASRWPKRVLRGPPGEPEEAKIMTFPLVVER